MISELVQASNSKACVNTMSVQRGSLLFHAATRIRDPELVKMLIDYKADVNRSGRYNPHNEECGMLASVLLENEKWNQCAAILDTHGASLSQRDRRGMSVLHHYCNKLLYSTKAAHLNAFVRLLKRKKALDIDGVWSVSSLNASVFAAESEGSTALMLLVMNNGGFDQDLQLSMLKKLLEANADVNITGNSQNYTPLLISAQAIQSSARHVQIVQTLLQAGADPTTMTLCEPRCNAWYYIIANSSVHPQLLELALHHPNVSVSHLVHCPDGTLQTPLMLATRHAHNSAHATIAIDLLLRAGASINTQTALITALHAPVVVEHLLNNGADPNVHVQEPPLVLVVRNLQPCQLTMQLLLAHGADANWTDRQTGQSVLHATLLSAQDAEQPLQLLLKYGAIPRADKHESTPLAIAIQQSRPHAVMCLLTESFHAECSICGDLCLLEPLSSCGHAFCSSCMQNWYLAHLLESPVVRCPSQGCGIEIDYHDIRRSMHHTHAELFMHFDRRIAELCCVGMNDFAWCPNCSFGGIVPCSDTVCWECGHVWCGFCKSAAHKPGEQCELEQEVLSVEFYKTFARPCPSCRAQTEHTGGCSHMRCAQCQTEWCWVCGRLYQGRYTFDLSTDPCG
jgi:ankyrin repeat protein